MQRLAELLTVIIPCKNEESYIGKLLEDLDRQRGSKGLRVIVSDGGSTDRTIGAIKARQLTLRNIQICIAKGGSVSRGRNEGLAATTTPYIAFIDADTRLFSPSTLLNGIKELKSGYEMVGAPIKCYQGSFAAHLAFKIFNLVQKNYIKWETFCVGQFCMAPTLKIKDLGGFDETVDNSEDYLLSRKISVGKFKLLKEHVGQDDRRFKKMGYFGFVVLLVRNFIFRNNIKNFRRKTNYWQ
jgi:glycosyltransferase involved in cell wall biosynthesis